MEACTDILCGVDAALDGESASSRLLSLPTLKPPGADPNYSPTPKPHISLHLQRALRSTPLESALSVSQFSAVMILSNLNPDPEPCFAWSDLTLLSLVPHSASDPNPNPT